MVRFFSAMAYAGRLYVEGWSEKGPGDARLLVYWEEAQVDLVLNTSIGDRKVRTAEELQASVEVSRSRAPAIKVWIAESLAGEIAMMWQAS
jgi:hypothetical protein